MNIDEKEFNKEKYRRIAIIVAVLLAVGVNVYYYIYEMNSPVGKPMPGENVVEKIEETESEEETATTEEAISVPETTQEAVEVSGSDSLPAIQVSLLPEDQLLAAYNNTLIIGDSRVEGFRLYSGVKNAVYFSMKGLTVDKINDGKEIAINGTNYNISEVLDSYNFDRIIIAEGMNELGWNSIDLFITEYGTLIDTIAQKQPNAKIILHAVLPVTQSKDSSDGVFNNSRIAWYNDNIMKLATSKNALFVDPSKALSDENGFLVSDSSTDGIHLTSQYCKIWANYLASMV